MWDTLTTTWEGQLRSVRSIWRPHSVKVEELTSEINVGSSELFAWLDHCSTRGIHYQVGWRRVERRIQRMVESFPALIDGSLAKKFIGGSDVFEFIHVNNRGGRFLSALANQFAHGSVVEIGTAFGVSGMYLLAGMRNCQLWTFDPCDDWIEISERNLASVGENFFRVGEPFEDGFPTRVVDIGAIGMAFVDGIHTWENVHREVGMLMPQMADESVLVLHDVHLNDEMCRAWDAIKSHERVRCSAFVEDQFGVCELGPPSRSKPN